MAVIRQVCRVVVLVAFCAPVFAKVTAEDLPSCAINCFRTSPPSNASSQSCRLTNSDFEATFSPCFYEECSIKDALTALNKTSILCEIPERDISWAIRGFVIASTIVASVVIGLRVLLKYRGLAGGIGWDDSTIVIAVILTMDAAVGQFLAAWYGMGKDQWKVPVEDVSTVYKCFFIAAVGYKLGNAATRISILCFYLRVFGTTSACRPIITFIVINAVIGVTFAIADTLQCQPVASFWDGWDGELSGKCDSLSAISWAHSILNIVLDVATLAIAFWMVNKLNMRWRKKAAVIGMFLLGSAITLVSFLRLMSLSQLSNARNRTWNLAPVAYWSAVEMFFGLVCACLPALNALIAICCDKRDKIQTADSGTGVYERHASDQRPGRTKTSDLTATSSRNGDLECDSEIRDGNSIIQLVVLPPTKEDDTRMESYPQPMGC
ncbi:hypothetical protein BKA67DRAFT_550497 [Truncatella angustata]|uniref:Extracellular membrane protein CFEM domain-containing protein n=1 Tax=Truncatella angustata TaxID=152316 RepID=A0A9P8UZZ1_9PEZI|nr:uncharacterized protein BKA67DRAFT_550497 [Truncatella angustata]KAH6661215.1 hypothetical protein BKA67DRAFT_550497 [Truncatella angustata]